MTIFLQFVFFFKEIIKDREKIILTPSHIKAYMIMMLTGLDYLHSNWVLHRVSLIINPYEKTSDKQGKNIIFIAVKTT